jgi:L-asparaginase
MIKVFTTGGTIDKVYFDAKSEYEVGEPQIVEILREANVTTVVHIEKLFQKDSLEMTDADRQEVRRRVIADPAERLLITHGTDTMVDTARALSGIDGKTIVLVGSLSPAMFKSSDAEFNVGFAMGALLALPQGVYIAMNGHIFEPEKVTKNRAANRFEALASE